MPSEHEKANTKPTPKIKERPADASGPFSTTAVAEELPPARPPVSDADKATARKQVESLQKEYDTLAEKVRNEPNAEKRAELLRQKGSKTREIDAVKRDKQID